MPWVKNKDGSKNYVPSAYTKEELPTWNELYNEFYKNQYYVYAHLDRDHLKRDPYWKIPHMKYLLAVVCNQLNKMLFEDGMEKDVVEYANILMGPGIEYIAFYIELDDHTAPSWMIGSDVIPPIYTIPFPNGEPNPFAISNVERINIAEIKGHDMYLMPKIGFSDVSSMAPIDLEKFNKILDFMMKNVKKYFEGEGVGWKDDEGHLIDVDPTKPSNGTDPAL